MFAIILSLKMKASIIILFSVFYLLVSTGASLNIHYCGGKLRNISFTSFSEKECCGGKMKSKGCCHNEKIVIKLKDKQQSNETAKTSFIKEVIIPNSKIYYLPYTNSYISKTYTPENYHAPPIFYKTSLFLKNRVLII